MGCHQLSDTLEEACTSYGSICTSVSILLGTTALSHNLRLQAGPRSNWHVVLTSNSCQWLNALGRLLTSLPQFPHL